MPVIVGPSRRTCPTGNTITLTALSLTTPESSPLYHITHYSYGQGEHSSFTVAPARIARNTIAAFTARDAALECPRCGLTRLPWHRIRAGFAPLEPVTTRSRLSMMRFWTRCTVAALALCLAVTAFPGRDIVLCIGPHGHIALEYAQNGRCAEGPCRPVGEAPRVPGMDRNDHACGDCLSCVDIPLAQGPVTGPASSLNGSKKKSSSPANPALSVVLPARLAQNLFGAASPASLPPPDGGVAFCTPPRVLRI